MLRGCAYGAENSEIRKRSDQIFKHVLAPAVEGCGYEATRADHLPTPGVITQQIIEHLMDDELVIADLTTNNPNVTYELALRHAFRKPVIQIKDSSDSLPFDIVGIRTIDVDYRYIDSMEACRKRIVEQVKNVEAHPEKVESPVTFALNLKTLSKDDPQGKVIKELVSQVQQIKNELESIKNGKSPGLSLGLGLGRIPLDDQGGIYIRTNPDVLPSLHTDWSLEPLDTEKKGVRFLKKNEPDRAGKK